MAYEALIANKIRTLLSMLGIIIGVSTVIVVVGIGLGAQQKIAEQYKNLSVDSIIVFSSRGGAGSSKLEAEDVDYLLENSQYLREATAMTRQNLSVSAGKESGSYDIMGVRHNYFDISNLNLAEGRLFTKEEVDNRERLVIIGNGLVDELFDGDSKSAVGQIININKKKMEVIGTLQKNGTNMGPMSYDDSIFVPYTTGNKILFGNKAFLMLMLLANDVNALPFAMEESETLLRQAHRIKEGKDSDFRLRDAGSMVSSAQESEKTMTILLTGVASIVLIVSGIGIMNVMFVTVAERTKEIGIMKAIGAKQKDILIQFLLEAIMLCSLAGIIGILFGQIIIPFLNKLDGWFVIHSVIGGILSFAFSVLVGIFFGFYPAYKASKLDPVDALRLE